MSLRPNARGMRDPAGNEGMGHFVRLAHRCATVEASQRDSHGALCDARIIRTPPLRPIPYDSGKFNFAIHLNHLLLRPYDDCVADGRAKSPDRGPVSKRLGLSTLPRMRRAGQDRSKEAERRQDCIWECRSSGQLAYPNATGISPLSRIWTSKSLKVR